MRTAIGVVFVLIVSGAGLFCSALLARRYGGEASAPIVFVGEKIVLASATTAATCTSASDPKQSMSCRFAVETTQGAATQPTLTLLEFGTHLVTSTVGGQTVTTTWRATPIWTALPAMLGIVILMLFAPSIIRTASGDTTFTWMHLLSEPGGGYSLSKTQLAIWWVPAMVITGAILAIKLDGTNLPASFAVLLGLSSATGALGVAASPRMIAEKTTPNALTDLVKDWQDTGDFSRYQYLMLSVVGSASVIIAFILEARLMEIPTELLALIGASQTTYLATKAIKASREEKPT